MKKNMCCVLLACTLLFYGCEKERKTAGSIEEKHVSQKEELTLMHVDADKEPFLDFIEEAEQELNMKIHVISPPANADNRHAKISTILSAGDTSVDLITVNDEMISEFKHMGYLEPLGETVMTEEVREQYPQEYLKEIAMVDEEVYSVPYLLDIMVFWVNQEYLQKAGIEEIRTLDDFKQFLSCNYGENCYGYGGAWESTYAYNDIFQFINLFGGDYYDWSNENTRDAVAFLYEAVKAGEMPKEGLIDQYEQMEQKFLDGRYGSIFMYSGAMIDFLNAGQYGADGILAAPLPLFGENVTNIATWQYVLNKGSKNKEASQRFLKYVSGREGSLAYAVHMNRLPVRMDILLEEELPIVGFDELKQYIRTGVEFRARPLSIHSMEDIRAIGYLFQQYITDQVSLEDFCKKSQEVIEIL